MDSECQDMYLTYLYAGKLEIFPSCVCESLVPVHWSMTDARVRCYSARHSAGDIEISSEEHEITLVRRSRSEVCEHLVHATTDGVQPD